MSLEAQATQKIPLIVRALAGWPEMDPFVADHSKLFAKCCGVHGEQAKKVANVFSLRGINDVDGS